MIPIPTKQALEKLVNQQVPDSDKRAQFVNDYLSSLTDALKLDPRQYRAYSFWWHRIKLALNERGINDFGVTVDNTICELTKHLDETDIVCAGFATKLYTIDHGNIYNSEFIYIGDDQEEIPYHLVDEEMEQIISSENK